MAAIVRSVRRVLAGVALALAAAGALGAPSPAPPHGATEGASPAAARDRSGPPRVLAVTVDGAITGGTAEYLAAALRRARDERFDAVALTLDTPGGALDATREIVQGMLA